MTARRTIAIGLGGAVAVIAAAVVGNLLGIIVGQALREEWTGHATVHIVFGGSRLRSRCESVASAERRSRAAGPSEPSMSRPRSQIALVVSL